MLPARYATLVVILLLVVLAVTGGIRAVNWMLAGSFAARPDCA